MPQPDRADPGWRDKDAQLAQRVGSAGLAIGREIGGGFDDGLLGGVINPIGQVGLAPGTLEQRLHAAFVDR